MEFWVVTLNAKLFLKNKTQLLKQSLRSNITLLRLRLAIERSLELQTGYGIGMANDPLLYENHDWWQLGVTRYIMYVPPPTRSL